MSLDQQQWCFQQMHVDVARNATDDFNPFHDPHRWDRVRGNPYGGPIVLGFQLEALADYLIERQRARDGAGDDQAMPYTSYEFRFAGALKPSEHFAIQVRRTLYKDQGASALNRVVMRRSDGGAVLLGSRTDTSACRPSAFGDPVDPRLLRQTQDRSYLPGTPLFVKHKYLTTSNAKNFLLGSLVDQHHYFDELAERVTFPPIFTASLVSCALLERAWAEGYDFESDPQLYVSHRITMDRRIQQSLRSNNRLDILAGPGMAVTEGKGLSKGRVDQLAYRCTGMVAGRPLFNADVQTATLRAVLGA